MLVEQKRFAEAVELGQNAANAAPDDTSFRALVADLKRMSAR
jgi:hypothetical protein